MYDERNKNKNHLHALTHNTYRVTYIGSFFRTTAGRKTVLIKGTFAERMSDYATRKMY